MDQAILQRRFTPGRQVWLVIVLVLGLALSTHTAAAKECHRETPMPADVHLSAPGPEVPEVIARFAGAWIGEWEQSGGLCHTLVVEEVLAHGDARVIYSVGTSVDLNIRLPGYWRASGSIANGELRFHLPTRHTQEADGTPGIPPLGYGLYPNVDDIAKLTTLLHNGGRHQGQQLLSAAKVAEALYKTETRGLPSGRANQFGDGRYHLSLWSEPYRTANGCFFQIPYMAGWGGNLVVLLPNSTSAFRITDGYTGDIDMMVWAGEAIRPFACPSGPGKVPSGGR